MTMETLIPIPQLSQYYEVEIPFFVALQEFGILEFATVEQVQCLHIDDLGRLEKVVRLHRDLQMNLEGIDVVLHLLARIETLQAELHQTRRRLQVYERLG